ncbi:MAG: CRISPR-associated endonuclease Cas2 [candidate division WOR-3 bacterium]
MFLLVSYDIINNRRRSKVCNILKDYGKRVQFSVFECLLDSKDLIRLKAALLKLINEKEDNLRIYQLCESCKKNVLIYGNTKITEDEEVYII